jgi:hypothetical protein
MQTPSQSLASSQRDVSLLLLAQDDCLLCVRWFFALEFINLSCWFKTSAFRPKGAPRNKRSDVALSGADWGGDADPFPIFGFISTGCFLIAWDWDTSTTSTQIRE